MLRYQENNELHRDFHGGTELAIRFIIENYGLDAAKEILRRVGREVYRSIHDKLAAGDGSELIEHLNWFYHREGAPYSLTVTEDEIRFEVFECPAHRHMRKLGLPISEDNCLQTTEVNAGMCEGTCWESIVEKCSADHCIQIFRRKASEEG